MKKIWKQKWKYYLLFQVIAIVILWIMGKIFVDSLKEEMPDTIINYIGDWAFYHFRQQGAVVGVLLIIEKSIIMWLEKEDWERYFLEFLPVTRKERFRMQTVMDSLLIMVPVILGTATVGGRLRRMLSTAGLEIPWMSKALAGIAISTICYLLMILGILYFLQSVFVGGFLQILGSVGGMSMLYATIYLLYIHFEGNTLFQWLYGFFSANALGDRYCYQSPYIQGQWWWGNALLNPPVFYRGEPFEPNQIYEEGLSYWYAFSDGSSYLWYTLGYLAIAVICLLLYGYLTDKKELSESVFYFSFGKYQVSAIAVIMFFALSFTKDLSGWQKVLTVLETCVLFCLILYWLTPRREKSEQKRV